MSAAVLWCHRPTTASVLSLTPESVTTEQTARPGLDGTLGYLYNWGLTGDKFFSVIAKQLITQLLNLNGGVIQISPCECGEFACNSEQILWK